MKNATTHLGQSNSCQFCTIPLYRFFIQCIFQTPKSPKPSVSHYSINTCKFNLGDGVHKLLASFESLPPTPPFSKERLGFFKLVGVALWPTHHNNNNIDKIDESLCGVYTKLLNIFKCKLLSQNANNFQFFKLNKLPIVEEIMRCVSGGVLRNSFPQNTLPIYMAICPLWLWKWGLKREREREVLKLKFFLKN